MSHSSFFSAHAIIFTVYASILSVYLLVDLFLLIGAIRQMAILLWTWIIMAIIWSGLIIVGIVVDGGANFALNSSTIIKLTSLIFVIWSVFVVFGAISETKQSKKWRRQLEDDLPPSYEETLKIAFMTTSKWFVLEIRKSSFTNKVHKSHHQSFKNLNAWKWDVFWSLAFPFFRSSFELIRSKLDRQWGRERRDRGKRKRRSNNASLGT